jgi:hypothetical protein
LGALAQARKSRRVRKSLDRIDGLSSKIPADESPHEPSTAENVKPLRRS